MTSPTPDTRPPNIIFFFTDQQRWDTCGCYRDTPILSGEGQADSVTPNIDRLAARGVRFKNAFTCQPVCGPARACIQTGKYATELGCHTNHRMLPLDEKTIANHFSENGYEVGYIGKWHLASCGPKDGPDDFRELPVPPERRGGYKDHWIAADVLEFTSHSYDGHMFDADMNKREFPEGRYRADAQTDWVIEYLQGRTLEKPFFLFVSYIEPHQQNDHNHFEGPHGSKERFKDFVPPGDLTPREGNWPEEYPDYLGCVNNLDANLGRVVSELENRGILDNTVIAFTTDHGCHFRTRNGEYKRSCHDACIHIPMVIGGPGFTGGKVVDNIVSLMDIPPTLINCAGIEPPDTMRGRPLQELAGGTATDWPQEAFLQISESHCGRAIRTRDWTYCVAAPDKKGSDPGSDVYVESFLYDLEADPHQQNNLVDSPNHASIRAQLAETLKRRMSEAGE
ncbi:sulfatase-like hydrolase/transferase, partial [Verrucomicrobiota bacterium]